MPLLPDGSAYAGVAPSQRSARLAAIAMSPAALRISCHLSWISFQAIHVGTPQGSLHRCGLVVTPPSPQIREKATALSRTGERERVTTSPGRRHRAALLRP